MRKHLVFIINPKSGVERRKEIKEALEAHLDKNLYSYELQNTEYARHGTVLAKEAAQNGAYAVIAVGGDGSVNDIIHGLHGTGTILGIIPKGSGNGTARTLRVPLDLIDAIKVLNTGNVKNIDVAFANDRLFISNGGVAFDALVAKKFSKSKRRGLFNYSWLVTKHMWTYKAWNWQINIDGKDLKEKAFMVVVANGQQFGYDFKIAPMANIADGVLNVIIIRNFPRILGGIIAFRLARGTITGSPYVKHYTGKVVTISNPSLNLMQTDGDAFTCKNHITFRIEQAAQRVIVP